MKLLAPAKINLHLRVGPRREDGFHSLLSWMCTVALFDNLTLEPADSGGFAGSKSVSLECNLPTLPVDESNLIVRIASAFLESLAVPSHETHNTHSTHATTAVGLRASLEKRIPIGAGLGGGSSDGARTLLGLNHLLQTQWAVERLSEFAARFGSDIPFFVHGPSCVCQGRGEMVQPIAKPNARWAVLMLPKIMMPTPLVYRRFDELGLGNQEAIETDPGWVAWTRLPAMELLPKLVNDLEAPAFAIEPTLEKLKRDAEDLLKRPVRMSGSGSSLFTLFDSQSDADRAAANLSEHLKLQAVAARLAPTINDDLSLACGTGFQPVREPPK